MAASFKRRCYFSLEVTIAHAKKFESAVRGVASVLGTEMVPADSIAEAFATFAVAMV